MLILLFLLFYFGLLEHKIVSEIDQTCKWVENLTRQNCSYIGGWLKHNNYHALTVYSPIFENVDRLVIDELSIQRNISFSWLISSENFTYNSWKKVRYVDNIVHMDDAEVIIVPNPAYTEEVISVLVQKSSAIIINTNDIIWDVKDYEDKYVLIERLYQLQKRQVQTLVFKMPCAKNVRNPTEWEKIVGGWKWKNHRWMIGDLDKYFKMSGNREEYMEFFSNWTKFLPAVKYRDYRVLSDFQSPYVNIINHVRRAVDIPTNALHTVHIVGDSTAIGYDLMDKDTSASVLQRNINQGRSGNEALYSCLIYGTGAMKMDILQRLLRDVIVHKEDIVVILLAPLEFFWEFEKSCEENGVPVYDSQRVYNRPHTMGEVFNDWIHMNPNGNKKTGELLFDRLFVHSSRMTMPGEFCHYYCGRVTCVLTTDIKSQQTWAEDPFSTNPDFRSFMRNLGMYRNLSQVVGVVVMNCNPFTLGHGYLVNIVAAKVDRVYVLVVEEDRSEFPFEDRLELVNASTASLSNVVVLPSSRYIISGITLPEYFVKGQDPDAKVDATMDLELFCKWIVPALGVHTRFVGEESLDRVTLQYNKAMVEILPKFNVNLEIIVRKEIGGTPISASRVRKLLKTRDFDAITAIVPKTTSAYLQKKFSQPFYI